MPNALAAILLLFVLLGIAFVILCLKATLSEKLTTIEQ